jgi:NAD(P)-dependent dehydrogenase (short-subunit alcohol dehydrogenase family)
VVTGATTGIGAAVAKRLADLGFRVYAGVHGEEDISTVNKHRPLFRAIRKSAEERGKNGSPVEEAVGAIVHAVAAPKPRTRYIVGNIARQIAVVSLLPDKIRDWLVLRLLGI